jgi:hypothetical protein
LHSGGLVADGELGAIRETSSSFTAYLVLEQSIKFYFTHKHYQQDQTTQSDLVIKFSVEAETCYNEVVGATYVKT